MKACVLSPEAESDVWNIWQYLATEAGLSVADRVESAIWEKLGLLAGAPGIGHWRQDLTDAPVKFFSVFSYLIVYRPETRPLEIVAVLHARRDIARLLKNRV